AHSHGHQTRDRYPGASDISSPPCVPRLLPAGAMPGGPCTHWRSAAFSRRTWTADIHSRVFGTEIEARDRLSVLQWLAFRLPAKPDHDNTDSGHESGDRASVQAAT